jgi:methionyl-tRNA formyltransferase
MKVSILISEIDHPIMPYLHKWSADESNLEHSINIYHDKKDLVDGDILFLISCGQILNQTDRQGFKKTLVLHASDLPHGRGWSPHVWSILKGYNKIVVSLLEADDSVDTGDIWKKEQFNLDGTELCDEINRKLFNTELSLISYAIENFHSITPVHQPQHNESHFPRRTAKDSEIDVHKSIAEQFDLMRVADPDRYPTFFEYRNRKFIFRLEPIDE